MPWAHKASQRRWQLSQIWRERPASAWERKRKEKAQQQRHGVGGREAKSPLRGLSGVPSEEETCPWHLAGSQKGEVKTNGLQGLSCTRCCPSWSPYPTSFNTHDSQPFTATSLTPLYRGGNWDSEKLGYLSKFPQLKSIGAKFGPRQSGSTVHDVNCCSPPMEEHRSPRQRNAHTTPHFPRVGRMLLCWQPRWPGVLLIVIVLIDLLQ